MVARDDNRARRDRICLPISILTTNFYFYLGPIPYGEFPNEQIRMYKISIFFKVFGWIVGCAFFRFVPLGCGSSSPQLVPVMSSQTLVARLSFV